MIVEFSCRGERPFARKRSWLESLPFTRKKHTIGVGQSLFLLSSSRERSEHLKFDLSQLFKAFSVQRFFDRDAESSS